jgi:hypothetical protein
VLFLFVETVATQCLHGLILDVHFISFSFGLQNCQKHAASNRKRWSRSHYV